MQFKICHSHFIVNYNTILYLVVGYTVIIFSLMICLVCIEFPLECPRRCGQYFMSEVYLDRHISIGCSVGRTQYPCDNCNKIFNRSSNMKRHFLMCAKVPPNIKCDSCEKMFWRKDKLKHHKAMIHKKFD